MSNRSKDKTPNDPVEMLKIMRKDTRESMARNMIGDLGRWDRATKVRIADAMGLPHDLIKPHRSET